MKHVLRETVPRETQFDKHDLFGIPCTDNQKLFSNMAFLILKQSVWNIKIFKDTETTSRIAKHIPISVSISSNLIQKPIFLCDPNPRDLVSSFVEALENFWKVKLKWKSASFKTKPQ